MIDNPSSPVGPTEAPVALTLEYDGTAYVGWQLQPNGRSIQGGIERALSEIFKQPIRVVAAGRTDAGVHALGQVVSFHPPRSLPEKALLGGVNALMPHDIAVKRVRFCRTGFDARRSAQGKRYRYAIVNGPVRSPLRSRYSWEIYRPLALEPMQRGAEALLGEHDFSAFRAAGCEAATAVRRLDTLRIDREGECGLSVTIEATAFLRHMVRNIVGTLVEVGLGKRDPAEVAEILRSRDRAKAGPTAPAHGLTLVEVFYDGELGPRPPPVPTSAQK